MTEETTPTKADRPMLWRQQHLVGIVAVVLTLIFGATGVYFYFVAEPQARLDIQLMAEPVIADLALGPSEQLKLTFGEEQIERASLVSLLVTNSGNLDLVPINQEDLNDRLNARITIEFPEGVRILDTYAGPSGDDRSTELTQIPTNDPNKATFVVLLMNREAEAQIGLVVADYKGNRTVLATPLGKGIRGEYFTEMQRRSGWVQLITLTVSLAFGVTVVIVAQNVRKIVRRLNRERSIARLRP